MKYFIFEPAFERKPVFFATKEEWQKVIDDFDPYANYHDDGWSEEINSVMAGTVPDDWKYDEEVFDNIQDALEPHQTHNIKMIDKEEKPADLDEDWYSASTGEHWHEEWSYRCNYELSPIEVKK